ncbi:hypothetical protein PRIC1_011038 [Phytophthora ramorum]
MKAADGAAGRKPWRYYYVMAFPLGSGGVTQDKLEEMTEMTTAIEQREEEYLRKVEARNAAHAAALEAERRAAERKGKPTMASHVAWVLRRLYVVSVVLLLLAVGVLYVMFLRDDGRDHVPEKLMRTAAISVVLLLVVNAGGWVAAHRSSVNGARVLLVINVALVIGLALLLDEVRIAQSSHKNLRGALAGSQGSLTQDAIDLILNGGTVPSLVQRFVFDAPSVFLQWLSAHCAGHQTKKHGYASVAIDRRDFFSPMWRDSEKTCITSALRRCIRIEEVVVPVLIGELVMVALQVLFTGLFLAVCDPLVAGKTSKRRRPLPLPKSTSSAQNSSANLSTALTRLLTFGTVLFGSSNAIASADLLHFCSVADFHALFTWIMVVCLVSGLSAMFAALLVGCRWRQQLAGVLLVLAVAAEVFMLAELIKTAAELIGPDMTADSDQVQVHKLREVYVTASAQTCPSIKHWISHVCVGMAAGKSPAEFDLSCQHEFVALLVASFNFTDSYLAWSIGVKLALLVQLILPALRQAVVNVVSYVCCISSRDNSAVNDVERVLQQSSPPLDYDEALEMYLRSMRTKDPTRIAAEREAFEKEWSTRTGRMLSDVHTPHVVVTANDFGAIVRTLMLRRLTAGCKLDVSLSVSADGQHLLVRMFASDNLLLATLCEKETYRLQFADAVDPGRNFWRDKKEVNADQKVLDANTVKHKLKLLLAEKAMPPKEAVCFPGESLPRVSARVHALSRISRAPRGLIRCRNPAPAFASYSPNIQRQFIYKKYPNRLDIPDTYRRSAVLRTIDCIRLTRLIVDAEFDTNATITSGLASSFHCLHSSSRFDLNSRAALASSWITFWHPIQLPGEFGPDEHAILNLMGRLAPFRQPLQRVRDYFGELIAFYFAWLAFYAKMLVLPAAAALVVVADSRTHHSLVTELWIFYSNPHSFHSDNANVSEGVDTIGATLSLPEVILGLVVIAWSFALTKLWERTSVWYQLQWGVTASDADSFHYDDDRGSQQISSTCSEFAYVQRQLCSWLCVLCLASTNLVVVLALLLAQGMLVDAVGEKLAVLGSFLCQAYLVQWNGACIPSVAHALSRWENPGCSSDRPAYRGSMVAKMFTLQLFNTFTGLIILMLSGVGGLAMLVQFVAPLRPLYIAYNARIEGHIGVFIQMETLLIALFAAQLSIRVFLIVSAVGRFRAVRREERSYSRRRYDEESTLSPYPGPHKDYVQLVMQLGLVVTFSGVCPLLPMLALIDCAVKLRQNALELCCIRQRPEPEEVKAQGISDLGLWTPCVFLMLKISVPIALALVFFTADNYDSVAIERRVGWWLIGVLGIWLVAQLLWFLVPRESRQAEEARARNSFLVDRYFGHAEVIGQKAPSEGENRGIRAEKRDINLQESAPSAEESLQHYKERLELLQRLNVALRKREEIGGPISLLAAEIVVPGEGVKQKTEASDAEVHVEEEMEEGRYPTNAKNAEKPVVSSAEEEVMRRASGSSEEMIVGYFRPVRGTWPPPQSLEGEKGLEELTASIIDPIETPLQRPPRRGSVFPETPPIADLSSSEGGGEGITGGRVESGSEAIVTGQPSPMRLSKLFKRMPPSALDESSQLQPHVSPFVSADSSPPQPGLDPGIFAPAEPATDEGTGLTAGANKVLEEGEDTNREASRELELLEEKTRVPASIDDQPAITITASSVDSGVDSRHRQFSPRLSFLTRRPRAPVSTYSDDGSSNASQADAGERTLLRQLSPRLSFLSRKSKRSSSKASDSEDGKTVPGGSSTAAGSSTVPEQSAPRRLSKLFKRVQPPSSTAARSPEPPPRVIAEISTFDRTETATAPSDTFDFLSDARSEGSVPQTSLPVQRRRSSGNRPQPPSPPPVYERVDLSGLEAVREAANRRQFDFSADEQGTNTHNH